MKKIIYILFIILLFGSCEKYIDIAIPDEGRKMAVNCFLNDTDKPILMLTRSKFILDSGNEFSMIDSAKAYLYQDGIQVAEFFQQDTSNIPEPWDIGAYVADYICQSGKQYTIKVMKNGETITASTQIPHSVTVQSIDTMTIVNQDGYKYLRVKITINDPANIENFYQFSFRTISFGYEQILSFPVNQSDFGLTGTTYQSYLLSNDKLFNGQSKTFIFDLDGGSFYDIVTPLSVVVNGVSKDMFLYYQQLQKYQNAQNAFLAEPVMMYTNIENGLGIFAGYSSHITTIDVPRLNDDIIIEGKTATMIIKSKITQAFGSTGSTTGIVFFGIGVIMLFYTWKTVFLVIIGAFFGFTNAFSYIDTDRRRVKLTEFYFGIIPVGKWIQVDDTMSLGYKMTNDGWSVSSLSSRTLDIPDSRYTIILYDINDMPIISLMKLKSEEEMTEKMELIATLLHLPL